ncbi:MAG: 30S ribosomal protein S4 [Patescibacteria group bacterium]
MSLTDSQCKKCRRAGEKLFLKGEKCNSAKCILVKRNFPPGVHAAKGFGKLTNYGKQLKEKQKAKRIYGLREKQFENYFHKAFKKTGNTGELLFRALETRLDNVVFRLGFARSREEARQLVSHGHFSVDGRKVDIPSCAVKVGDLITLREKSQKMKRFADIKEEVAKKQPVSWLNMDKEELKAKVTGLPNLGDGEMNIDWRTIVEFYSK